ncbi:MAG: hypothetical protein LUE64_00060, partial [Candidatus Gastranaerophilales bacterium]|nr:hypothetical protein [Candidatus Gastranaerophilales bacterium]
SIKLMKNQKEQKQDLPVQNIQTGKNLISKGANEKSTPVQNLSAKTQSSTAFKGIAEKSSPVQNTNHKEQNNPFASMQPSFTGGIDQTIQIVKEIPKKKGLFTRVMDTYGNALSEPLAKIMGKLANTAPSKKLVQGAAKFDKPTARFSDLASFSITYFYVSNTRKSEKIEEERKLPLMINNVMTTAASSTTAFLIDKYTDKPMESLLKGYLKKHDAEIYNKSNRNIKNTLQNMLETVKNGGKVDKVDVEKLMKHSDDLLSGGVENLSDNFKEALKTLTNDSTVKDAVKQGIIKQEDITKIAAYGYEKVASSTFKNISKAKSLTVFTLTVRFLVTVLMTPVVGKVVSIVNKKLGREKPKEETENKKQETTIGMSDFQNLTK